MSKDKLDGNFKGDKVSNRVNTNQVVDNSYIRPELRGSYQVLTTGSGEREDYDDQPHY